MFYKKRAENRWQSWKALKQSLGLCAIFILLLISNVAAQVTPSNAIRKGKVYFYTNDSLETYFSLNLAQDLLQVNSGDRLETYSPRKVRAFFFTEENLGYTRYFYTFQYSDKPRGYKIPKFFEMLYNGNKLALLMRESIVVETVPMFDAFSNRTYMTTRQRISQEFFFLDWDNNQFIIRFKGSKRHLFELMQRKEKEITEFVKEQKLDVDRKEDLIKIVDYYNSLMLK